MADGPPNLEALLAHEPWIRSLARGLLFDGQEVDDVVQETWLAALRRPPRDPEAARGWLATVVRNLVRRVGRSAVRRSRREAAAARPEALPSPAEIAGREGLRRRAVEAVLALEEPYRSTVLWRYFEGLEPTEIARRTGEPAGTVRSRLSRGLDLLRSRLDAEHGGDRRAWSVALVPLARPNEGGAGVAGAAAVALGGFIMSNSAKAGLAVAVAGALAVVAWQVTAGARSAGPDRSGRRPGGAVATGNGARPPEPPPGPREPAPPEAVEGTPASASVAARGSGAIADPTVPGRRPAALSARVVSARTGRPVKFASVRPLRGGAKPPEKSTGADGKVEFPDLAPGDYRVVVSKRGCETLAREGVALSAGAARDLGDLAIRPLPALRGIVRSPEGAGVSGATVRVAMAAAMILGPGDVRGRLGALLARSTLGFEMATGPDGRFEVYWDEAHYPKVVLRATAAGRTAAFAYAELDDSGGAIAETSLTLGALAGRLSGRVLDHRGRPVPGATAVAAQPVPSPGTVLMKVLDGLTATADGEGRFQFDSLAEGEWALFAGLGRSNWVARPGVRAPADGVELVLAAPLELVGRVTDAQTGRPVAGAKLSASGGGGPSEVEADADGRFRLSGLDASGTDVSVSARGYVGRQLTIAPGRAGESVLDVALVRGAALAGRILRSGERRPIVGAQVFVLGTADTDLLPGGHAALSGADGTFRIEDLSVAHAGAEGPAELRVCAWAPGRAPSAPRVVSRADLGEGPGLEILLDPSPRITGRVVDSAGVPVGGAEVSLIGWMGGEGETHPLAMLLALGSRGRTDDAGRFELDAYFAGARAMLHVSRAGYQSGGDPVLVPGGDGVAEVTVTLEAAGAVLARVLDPQGRPCPGAEVWVQRATPDLLGDRNLLRLVGEPLRTVRTDSEGIARLAAIGPGPARVLGRAHGLVPAEAARVDVAAAGAPAEVTLRMEPPVEIRGRVVDDSGRGVAGISVEALGDLGAAATSGPGGEFAIVGLARLRYRLAAATEGWADSGSPVTADGGQSGVVLRVRWAR
ncbi:MAG: sigma-70 family RNA polymerase sigma factor [Planctomycetales bacterium]|nr:sigma-70 family RNA polymerase sigma factor [Planctomycetales bacterium]